MGSGNAATREPAHPAPNTSPPDPARARTEWTKSVKAAYSKILHAYSQPVVPKAAYEGQQFPPAYLFTAPQIDAPESGDDPASSQYAGNFVYKPPAGMEGDIEPPPFVPLVPSGSEQQPSASPGSAPVNNDWGDVPPPPKVDVGPPPPPLPSALHKVEPIAEYTIDCVNGEEDTTDVWCAAGEADRVTHLNLFHVRRPAGGPLLLLSCPSSPLITPHRPCSPLVTPSHSSSFSHAPCHRLSPLSHPL